MNARSLLCDGGYLLLIHCNILCKSLTTQPKKASELYRSHNIRLGLRIFGQSEFWSHLFALSISTRETHCECCSADMFLEVCWEHQSPVDIMQASGFQQPLQIPDACGASDLFASAYLSVAAAEQRASSVSKTSVSLVHFLDPADLTDRVMHSLSNFGWHVTLYQASARDIPAQSTILVLDDLSGSVLPYIKHDQWQALQNLINSGNKILWVSEGSQYDVSQPQNALIHGLARVARAEDPSLVLNTLDIEPGSGSKASAVINEILLSMQASTPRMQIENEYCERGGMIYSSRILLDNPINQAEQEASSGAEPRLKPLYGNKSCVRLQCERLGTVDSLHFSEVSTSEVPLEDDFVEVDIHAAGLNFKVFTDSFIWLVRALLTSFRTSQ
jgi:hypothetical protein